MLLEMACAAVRPFACPEGTVDGGGAWAHAARKTSERKTRRRRFMAAHYAEAARNVMLLSLFGQSDVGRQKPEPGRRGEDRLNEREADLRGRKREARQWLMHASDRHRHA